jgi:hypothetical protein
LRFGSLFCQLFPVIRPFKPEHCARDYPIVRLIADTPLPLNAIGPLRRTLSQSRNAKHHMHSGGSPLLLPIGAALFDTGKNEAPRLIHIMHCGASGRCLRWKRSRRPIMQSGPRPFRSFVRVGDALKK